MASHAKQVASTFADLTAAWATNDADAIAGLFTEDGSLINPFGDRADGRAAVAAMYGAYFDGMLRGTTTRFTLSAVRPVGDEHAFADGEQTIMGPDGTVVLAVHLASLLRREGDSWSMVDSRPYVFAKRPN